MTTPQEWVYNNTDSMQANRDPDRDILEARITESGISAKKFADLVLKRDERTLRSWRSGESPMPDPVRRFIRDPQPAPWPTKATLPKL